MVSSTKCRAPGQRGVTVVELLVVIIVISVILGFALMQRGGANEQLQRHNVAQELKSAFERARFNSVKRRAGSGQEALVTLTPNSFTLRTYNNDVNGIGVQAETTTTLPTGVIIALYDGTTLTTRDVSFNMRGETAASPAPQFLVCNLSCSNRTNATANIVLVTPTGTVNLLSGSSSLPVFGTPTITDVPTSTGINHDTVLP